MNGIDLTDLKAALVAHAGDLAQHLLGAATARLSSKRELRWGKHGSFSLVLVGSKAGIWRDHETEETGDLLALIKKVRGGSFPDALEFARGFIGGNFVQPSTPPPRRRDDDQDSDAARTKAALNIWHSADSIEHPIASRYLERRKLIVPSGIDGTVLRFHPHCPFGPGTRLPAIVALYRNIETNKPQAVMRTALTPDGVKIDRKLMGPGERMACKLTPDEDVEYGLHVSEGVETALAGMMLGFAPAWALGSSGGILNFPVLGGIDYLTIVVDNDEVNPKTGKRPGPHAAAECSERWAAAGREVFHIVPDNVGSDIADVVKGATS